MDLSELYKTLPWTIRCMLCFGKYIRLLSYAVPDNEFLAYISVQDHIDSIDHRRQLNKRIGSLLDNYQIAWSEADPTNNYCEQIFKIEKELKFIEHTYPSTFLLFNLLAPHRNRDQ